MINIRIAAVSDALEISEIYKHYVENTVISFEYIAPDSNEFAHRIAHKLEKFPFLVAVEDDKVIGYAYASEFRERLAYSWDAELSIYIDKEHCGKGIGKRLYSALIEILKMQNFATLYSGITYPNPSSVALHEKLGFELIGIYRSVGYKNEHWLDVMWYDKRIADYSAPKNIISFSELDSTEIYNILNDNQ